MATTVNEVRRPVIFVKKLTQEEFNNLAKLSDSFAARNVSELTKTVQLYTDIYGSLDIADTLSVNSDEEILCFTYDDFLTHWSEYKLWLLLQTH